MAHLLYNNDGQLTDERVDYQHMPCAVADAISVHDAQQTDYTIINTFGYKYRLGDIYKLGSKYYRLLHWIEGADLPHRDK